MKIKPRQISWTQVLEHKTLYNIDYIKHAEEHVVHPLNFTTLKPRKQNLVPRFIYLSRQISQWLLLYINNNHWFFLGHSSIYDHARTDRSIPWRSSWQEQVHKAAGWSSQVFQLSQEARPILLRRSSRS